MGKLNRWSYAGHAWKSTMTKKAKTKRKYSRFHDVGFWRWHNVFWLCGEFQSFPVDILHEKLLFGLIVSQARWSFLSLSTVFINERRKVYLCAVKNSGGVVFWLEKWFKQWIWVWSMLWDFFALRRVLEFSRRYVAWKTVVWISNKPDPVELFVAKYGFRQRDT